MDRVLTVPLVHSSWGWQEARTLCTKKAVALSFWLVEDTLERTDLSLYWTDSMNNTFIGGWVNNMARVIL